MKFKFFLCTLSSLFFISLPAQAALNVFSCEPEWASLATELGGQRITTFTATTAHQDPHHIEARPSLIAKLRRADLLICSGAELEVGWLPMLQRQAANSSVMTGATGYFEASAQVQRLEIPSSVDRSQGDVHAGGNPHVHLDPRRILQISEALSQRLILLDTAGKEYYHQRLTDFKQRWLEAMEQWQQQAKVLKGVRIVAHHKDWVYLFDWLQIEMAGALEPRPGLPTTAGHLASLVKQLQQQPAQMIVHTTYQSPRAAKRLAEITHLPVIELPYTVGGADEVNNLFDLFETTIAELTGGLQ